MNVDLDHLAALSEEKAVSRYFDQVNNRRLTWLLLLLFAYAVVFLIILVVEGEATVLTGAPIVVVFATQILRHLRFVRTHFYGFILWFHLVMLAALVFDPVIWEDSGAWLFIYPFVLIGFRLKPSGYLILHGIIATANALHGYLNDAMIAETVAACVIAGFCLPLSLFLTWRHKSRFLIDWTRARNNRDRLRMKKELEQAREIQLSFLPPGDPESEGLELSAISEPATEVGGDYYDYYRLDEHRLAVIIGDVSGHGVASGLVLSGGRSCLHLIREELTSPGEVLTKLNRVLKETTDKRTFMTMLLIVVDTANREVVLANAGHTPMVHYRVARRTAGEIRRPALPLGALAEVDYAEYDLAVATGDLLVLYSDGLTEIHDEDNTEYGTARLLQRIERCGRFGMSARATRDDLLRDVRDFMADNEQLDDITLVVIRIVEG